MALRKKVAIGQAKLVARMKMPALVMKVALRERNMLERSQAKSLETQLYVSGRAPAQRRLSRT